MNHCVTVQRQSGATLLVGLIFLIMMTIFAITSFNLAQNDLNIVSNIQAYNTVIDMGKATMELVMNHYARLSQNRTAILDSDNTISYDINGDNNNDITVTLPDTNLPCIKKIKKVTPDPDNPIYQGCIMGISGGGGSGNAAATSLCVDVIWEITAVANDSVTGATATFVQGINTINSTDADTATNYCN